MDTLGSSGADGGGVGASQVSQPLVVQQASVSAPAASAPVAGLPQKQKWLLKALLPPFLLIAVVVGAYITVKSFFGNTDSVQFETFKNAEVEEVVIEK